MGRDNAARENDAFEVQFNRFAAEVAVKRLSAPGRGRRVGLLGGSFNPAHSGHRHISLMALKRLKLDEVWWLVSPQNPLKSPAGMAPLEIRLIGAKRAANHDKIKVTDLESDLGTTFTAETLMHLSRHFPRHRFVWLMGADNLIQIDQWEKWQNIFHTVPIAVMARPTYSLKALASKAARRFAKGRVPEPKAYRLADLAPPAWAYLHTPLDATSATKIRAGGDVPWP